MLSVSAASAVLAGARHNVCRTGSNTCASNKTQYVLDTFVHMLPCYPEKLCDGLTGIAKLCCWLSAVLLLLAHKFFEHLVLIVGLLLLQLLTA